MGSIYEIPKFVLQILKTSVLRIINETNLKAIYHNFQIHNPSNAKVKYAAASTPSSSTLPYQDSDHLSLTNICLIGLRLDFRCISSLCASWGIQDLLIIGHGIH